MFYLKWNTSRLNNIQLVVAVDIRTNITVFLSARNSDDLSRLRTFKQVKICHILHRHSFVLRWAQL
jgi:hypothetical protein